MIVSDLTLEITSRCNLECSHCLRGDAVDVDLSAAHISSFLSNVDAIGCLTITGGEPTLAPNTLHYLVKELVHRQIAVENFYIVINGATCSDLFFESVLALWDWCSDGSISEVAISTDQYHQLPNPVDSAIATKKLRALKFVHERSFTGGIIKQGRAKYSGDVEVVEPRPYAIKVVGDKVVVYGCVYLNALGYVISSPDLSYAEQENYIVCDVTNFGVEALMVYNNNLEKKD